MLVRRERREEKKRGVERRDIGRERERKRNIVAHILIERKSGSKILNFKSILIFSTKGSCGLLRESMFTPNDVLVITSML